MSSLAQIEPLNRQEIEAEVQALTRLPLAKLEDQVSEELWACRQHAEASAEHARRAGMALIAVKRLLKHGDWLPWLDKFFEGDATKATRFMRIAEHWPYVLAQHRNGEELSVTRANQILSAARPRGIVPNGGDDSKMTPTDLARAIARALKPSGLILEPAAGDGDFVRALKPYGVVKTCEITRGRDFLKWKQPVTWVIGNPPWSKFRSFLQHAMTLAPNVAYFTTVNHYWTRSRVRDVREAGFGYRALWLVDEQPEGFTRTGFQLGVMHLQRGYSGSLRIDLLKSSGRRADRKPPMRGRDS